MIYEPAEDSYLLEEQVKNYAKKGMKVLDVGTGSGIQAEAAKEADVLALDINQECVDFVRKKGINCIKSNLFEKVKGKFDLIIFNPPYLPEDEEEPEDSKLLTTGGKKGNEILIRFFSRVKDYLNKNGKILIVFSSLTPNVNKIINKYGFRYKKLAEQKIPFETLYVYLVEQ